MSFKVVYSAVFCALVVGAHSAALQSDWADNIGHVTYLEAVRGDLPDHRTNYELIQPLAVNADPHKRDKRQVGVDVGVGNDYVGVGVGVGVDDNYDDANVGPSSGMSRPDQIRSTPNNGAGRQNQQKPQGGLFSFDLGIGGPSGPGRQPIVDIGSFLKW